VVSVKQCRQDGVVLDDNEKSVSWFREAFKVGLIAGGIAGIIYGYAFASLKEERLAAAETMCVCVLGGLAGGCAVGVAVGRVFKVLVGKWTFSHIIQLVGAVGGVGGAHGSRWLLGL